MKKAKTAFSIAAMAALAQSAFAQGNDPARRFIDRFGLQGSEVSVQAPDRRVKPLLAEPDLKHPDYRGLLAKRAPKGKEGERDVMRLQAIHEAGQAAGIHAGLSLRTATIREHLESSAYYLDWAYGFHLLLQDGRFMPPVIIQGNRSARKIDDATMTTAQVVYTLESDARIVMESPSWRDFLLRDLGAEPAIPVGLLPATTEEIERWEGGVQEGWVIGYAHADALHDSAVSLLTRTFIGMQTSLQLAMEGRLAPAVLASAERGITLDASGRTMAIDDRVYRITAPAQWNNPDDWIVIPRPLK